jgi:streptogramin lyase
MKHGCWLILAALGLASCGAEPINRDSLKGSSEPQVLATLEVDWINEISAGSDGLWTANYEEGTVSLIDPEANEVVRTIAVRDQLRSAAVDLAAIDENVWLSASDTGTLGHLNPDTNEVTAVVEAGPAGIVDFAVGSKEVWVAQYSGNKPLDPVSFDGTEIRSANEEVPPPGEKYSIYSDIAAGDAGVWALDESEGTLAAIKSSQRPPGIATTKEPLFTGAQGEIAVAHGYVWVETSDAETPRVARFDPSTSNIETIEVRGQDGVMAAGPDALWLLTHEENRGLLWRIDPETLEIDSEPLAIQGEFQLADISYGFGSVWVSHDTNLVTRIDPTGEARLPDPPPAPEVRGDADVCGQRGPWLWCPEARWLRRVVLDAGLEITRETSSVWEVLAEGEALLAWNAGASVPVEDFAAEHGYQRREGTDAFTDGTRILWEAQGLYIYLAPTGEESIDSIPNGIVQSLVDASLRVPMAANLTGAKPQPKPTGKPRVEETEDGRISVWPVSEDVEDEGKYLFTAPHCGIGWMVDFDASFWEAVPPTDYGNGEHYPFFYNSDEGTITFDGPDDAVYQASTGEEIQLRRLSGPVVLDPCD